MTVPGSSLALVAGAGNLVRVEHRGAGKNAFRLRLDEEVGSVAASTRFQSPVLTSLAGWVAGLALRGRA